MRVDYVAAAIDGALVAIVAAGLAAGVAQLALCGRRAVMRYLQPESPELHPRGRRGLSDTYNQGQRSGRR
jgi:hypothetical protein